MKVLALVLAVFGTLGVMLLGLIMLGNPHEHAGAGTLLLFTAAATCAICGSSLLLGQRRRLSAALLALAGGPVVVWVFFSVREPYYPYDWRAALYMAALPSLLVVAAVVRISRR